MSNEIKQRDTVRVSKDAPKMYFRGWDIIFKSNDCNVLDVDDDNAVIAYGPNTKAIPTKYLVKVGAEAKEPKFKVGDNVIVHYPNGDNIGRIQEVMLDGTYDIDYGDGCTGHNITMSQIEPYIAPKFKVGNWVMISGVFNPQLNGMIGWISRIDKDGNKVSFQDGRFAIVEDKYLMLITQPTEQTEAEKKPNTTIAIPVEVDLTDSYWDAYAADLASEITVKSMEKSYGCDPERIADYAVSVAKAVVEGLKRK